jgi:glycosyltransferase involved in cell wall biosynthesis
MIKFGIKIATYFREDNSTFSKIKRTLESVNTQTYKNWTVILVGDGYSNEQEFEQIVNLVPKEKILFYNLPKRYEKDVLGLSSNLLWCCGGVEATNTAIDICKKNNISHYCSLDDDDYWMPFHLEILNMAYESFPESCFVYTNSLYTDRNNFTRLFPPQNVLPFIKYDNLPPRPENLIHSSVSWDINKIPLKYRNVIEQGRIFPSDADMWDRIGTFCNKNNLKTLYIPITTVIKDSEADILK